MWWNTFLNIIESNTLQNVLLGISLIVALIIGVRQISLNDVVELYAIEGDGSVLIQNVGTRLIYIDKYIFNGKVYLTDSQILPPTYANAGAFYYVNLPGRDNPENHISIEVFYHDLDGRPWKSLIEGDKETTRWKIRTLPRTPAKNKQ
ncbi:MAG: hypothetical protein AB198_02690 [Parcubacteria bacterium C7867-003]|nr:MAG: hypothetical protein AB198_02690 [Parcubacteria bacterium C7867-003]